jgi:hypothetical protein
LEAIHRAQVPFLTVSEASRVEELTRGIPIPNSNTLVLKILCIRTPLDEPKELLNNPSDKDTLGCQERKYIYNVNIMG